MPKSMGSSSVHTWFTGMAQGLTVGDQLVVRDSCNLHGSFSPLAFLRDCQLSCQLWLCFLWFGQSSIESWLEAAKVISEMMAAGPPDVNRPPGLFKEPREQRRKVGCLQMPGFCMFACPQKGKKACFVSVFTFGTFNIHWHYFKF